MPDPTPSDRPILLGDGAYNDRTELHLLVEEYAHLREEVERLREEQKTLKEQQDRKGKDDKSQDKKGDDEGGAKSDKGGKQDKGEDGDKEKDQDDQPKEPVRKRASDWVKAHPLAVLAILIGLVVLVITGVLLWQYLESFESTDDAEVDGHINPIASRVAGTVVAVHVENSQNVKQGQVLVELDPRDYQVALAQSQANLAQAVAGVETQAPNVPITSTSQATQIVNADQSVVSAEAGVASAERMHESSLAELRQAEADAANAATEERRYRELVDKQEVSREMYDQRATAARAQQALVAARRAAAEANLKVVDQRRAEVNQARQRAEEARANEPRQVAIQKAGVANRRATALGGESASRPGDAEPGLRQTPRARGRHYWRQDGGDRIASGSRSGTVRDYSDQ